MFGKTVSYSINWPLKTLYQSVCRQTNLDKSLARVSVYKDKIF